jgi:integrase
VTPSDYGNEMVGGDGVTQSTINRWLKEIAIEAEIGYERGLINSSNFDQKVPDVMPHDMRGTFIMQLIRNNMQRTKLIHYTGHNNVSSLAPYERRVAQETDAREFLDHI